MASVAIIGTGIAGMGCAHFLHPHHAITVFEREGRIGGHAHTVVAREPGTGAEVPIDTGFMVFNRVTYPLLSRLFAELDVPVKRTDMSFSVRDSASGIEWCGSSLNHLFAQRRNLLRLRFVRMVLQIDRFNREAVAALDDPSVSRATLREYVEQRGYGNDFLELYLVPMSSAVWSTPPEQMLRFPAATLLRFFHNHGFLGLHTQHPWWTVEGGSREYVSRLTRPWRGRIRTDAAAVKVERRDGGVLVTTADGSVHGFDQVVIATHADQALRLLADATREEQRVLGPFRYQHNAVTLHTDAAVMPRTPRAWASWNYEVDRHPDGSMYPATHYWMNRLQDVSRRENFFVSVNRPERIAPRRVVRRFEYEHPLFDLGAVRAQEDLPLLNRRALGTTHTLFAGSYFRYGFHEDALMSAVEAARLILGRDPWSSPRTVETAPACA